MSLMDFTLPGSDPNAPNSFIRTPEQVAQQLALAQALSKGGSDYSPVQSPWQGAARMAQALAGAIGTYKANQGQRLSTANAAAELGNSPQALALGADPSEANIPSTPGQSTPALRQSDAITDAITDAPDRGQDPRASALAAALGGGSAPVLPPGNAALAAGLSAAPQGAGGPSPMALAAGLGAGTPYGTGNVGGGAMAPYQAAISKIESGGNYGALGPVTGSGDRAYGKYQVMGANIPQWTQAALGRPMTPQQFLADPQAQDAVFNHQFGGYVQKYGPQDAASMWLTGRTLANGGAQAADQNGTTGQAYADQMTRSLGNAPAAAAISSATNGGAHVPTWAEVQADNAHGMDSINAASAQPSPAGAAGASPMPGGPQGAGAAPSGAPAPSQALAFAPPAGSPAPAAPPPSPAAAPQPAPMQPQPQPGMAAGFHPNVQSLLNVLSDPWASPAQQQIAQQLLQTQMPTRPSIIDGPIDPATGYATKLLFSPTQGVLGRLNANGSIEPVGGSAASPSGAAPAIPAGVDPKKYRETSAEIAAKEAAPTATNELEFAQKLTDRQSYKEFSQALPTWNAFTQHIRDNSPAADKAIVDDFAKILNPGRAVTTGAFQLNMDAQSIPAAIQANILKAFSGDGELGPDARAQMAKVAQEKVSEYHNAWNTDAAQATKTAKAHNLAVERVIPLLPDVAALDLSKVNTTKTMAGPQDQKAAQASAALTAARDAIAKGAPRAAVIQRLRDHGIDPGGL